MKKNVIILVVISLVLTVIGVVMVMLFNSNKQPIIEEFDLTKYQWEIENFPSDKNVGQIDNAEIAIKKAKELWIEKYSSAGGKPYNPINGRKIETFYDNNNNCWHIKGTLPSNVDGSVPQALIQKDGKVLAVWMG